MLSVYLSYEELLANVLLCDCKSTIPICQLVWFSCKISIHLQRFIQFWNVLFVILRKLAYFDINKREPCV